MHDRSCAAGGAAGLQEALAGCCLLRVMGFSWRHLHLYPRSFPRVCFAGALSHRLAYTRVCPVTCPLHMNSCRFQGSVSTAELPSDAAAGVRAGSGDQGSSPHCAGGRLQPTGAGAVVAAGPPDRPAAQPHRGAAQVCRQGRSSCREICRPFRTPCELEVQMDAFDAVAVDPAPCALWTAFNEHDRPLKPDFHVLTALLLKALNACCRWMPYACVVAPDPVNQP